MTILSAAKMRYLTAVAASENGRIKPIIAAVAYVTGISERAILSQDRHREPAWARQLIYYLARRQNVSYPKIARVMGRDHKTVMHGVRAEDARRVRNGEQSIFAPKSLDTCGNVL